MLKRVCALSAILISYNTWAIEPGFYLGLMAGPSTNAASNEQVQLAGVPATTSAHPNHTQFAGRAFLGGKFNKYFGLETGVTAYSAINYHINGGTPCSDTNVRVTTVDLLGVGTLPMKHGFSAYGKLGGSFLYISSSADLHPNLANACGESTYNATFKPAAGLGVSYDINKNWVADLSWTRYAANGMINHLDFFALGFSWHFTDVTCGPFMCF